MDPNWEKEMNAGDVVEVMRPDFEFSISSRKQEGHYMRGVVLRKNDDDNSVLIQSLFNGKYYQFPQSHCRLVSKMR